MRGDHSIFFFSFAIKSALEGAVEGGVQWRVGVVEFDQAGRRRGLCVDALSRVGQA